VGIFDNDPYKRPDPHGVKANWKWLLRYVIIFTVFGLFLWGLDAYREHKKQEFQRKMELTDRIIERIIEGTIPAPVEEEPK